MTQSRPVYEIDGANFWTLEEFYDEYERKVPGGYSGRNLDAFNDVLRGGFGTPEGGFILKWRNSETSRERLNRLVGYDKLFDTLVQIIQTHGPGGAEADDGVELQLL